MEDEYTRLVSVIRGLEASSSSSASSTVDMSRLFEPAPQPSSSSYEELSKELSALSKRQQFPVQQPKSSGAAQLQVSVEKSAHHEPEMSRLAERVKGELAEALRSMRVEHRYEPGARNESDLVLPNLPVADQVGELERIADGLREGAFSEDQLEIVREELRGLSRAAKGARQGDELSKLRDSRLSDALQLLEGSRK